MRSSWVFQSPEFQAARGPGLRSHSLPPLLLFMGPLRQLFNSPLGVYIQFIAL